MSVPSQTKTQRKQNPERPRRIKRSETTDESVVRGDDRWNRRVLWLLMGLTFGTGIVDAIGYLALNHVFIGNMTGNIVILGMALVGADKLPVLGPLLAMLCFSLGASAAGVALRSKPSIWPGSATVLLLLAGALVLSMGALSLVLRDPDSSAQLVMSSVSAWAMGMQAYVARKLAIRDVTTVVVTSTLTAFAGELFIRPSMKSLLNRRAAAILAMLLGAAVGALMVHLSTGYALVFAGLIIVVVSILGHLATKSALRAGSTDR
ncbi:YoaK family protein [Paenarthrobacter sp. C1]|uniref:YoaK family protein n=1 Tax=Paenarthrobacter sp. C1 TaxID=3400220 RepID=UPI003BF4D5DD